MEESKKNSSVVVAIILAILLTLVLGYIIYDNLYAKNNSNIDNSEIIEEKKSSVQSISNDSEIVKKEIGTFDIMGIFEENLYKNEKYNISDITQKEVFYTAMAAAYESYESYVASCDNTFKGKVLTVDEINTLIEKYILGVKLTSNELKEYSKLGDLYKYKNGGIILQSPCGSLYEPSDFINKKIIKSETDEDYLYVYQKNAFAKYNSDGQESITYDYYKDFKKTNLVEKNLSDPNQLIDDNPLPNSVPNWDLYNTYKYTFKKINNVYYFQSFELYE